MKKVLEWIKSFLSGVVSLIKRPFTYVKRKIEEVKLSVMAKMLTEAANTVENKETVEKPADEIKEGTVVQLHTPKRSVTDGLVLVVNKVFGAGDYEGMVWYPNEMYVTLGTKAKSIMKKYNIRFKEEECKRVGFTDWNRANTRFPSSREYGEPLVESAVISKLRSELDAIVV